MNIPVAALLERKGHALHTIGSAVSVSDAVAEMNRHRVGAILVVDGAKLAGIFTERDVLRRVVGAGLDPRRVSIAEVMTAEVLTIGPEATLEETSTIFTEKRCRHLPVLEAGRLVGLISIGDITRWMSDSHRHEAEHLKNYIAGGLTA